MYTDCTTQDNVVFKDCYEQKNDKPDILDSVLSLGQGVIARRPVQNALISSTEGAVAGWEIVIPSSGSTNQTWAQQKKAVDQWSILSFPAVCAFCELCKGFDIHAMQHIYDLVENEFSGYSAEYELAVDDDGNPELILHVDAQNMPIPQLIEKELRVFEVIARSSTLSNANKYNILSIV